MQRRGQNEHLKQGDEQKQIYILWINEGVKNMQQ